MAELIVIRDPLRGERRRLTMTRGAIVADELRRLFPDGIAGRWELYAGEVHPDCYLPIPSHESLVVDDDRYVLVQRPAGPMFVPILIATLVSTALSLIISWLNPRPKSPPGANEDQPSANNILAGQTNQLRAGGRVPDILGAVRAYPDLLTAPIEQWTEKTQSLQQFMVLGVGDYSIASAQLGETPLANISGAILNLYATTTTTPAIPAVKVSPEISSMALSVDAAQALTTGATFTASSKQMSTTSYVPIIVGQLIRIDQTTSNNAVFEVTAAAPSSQVSPPFLYTLAGPVVNETAPAPLIRIVASTASGPFPIGATVSGATLTYTSSTSHAPWSTADYMQIVYPKSAGGTYDAKLNIATVTTTLVGGPFVYHYQTVMTFTDLNGVAITFPAKTADPPPPPFSAGVSNIVYTYFPDPGPPVLFDATTRDSAGTLTTLYNLWTDWFVAPLPDPDEIWLDISFPSGLVWYDTGVAKPYPVQVDVQFRRVGAVTVGATRSYTFTESAQGLYRWTERVNVAGLALPSGSSYIQVRMQRVTAWQQDDATNQYISDTRFERLAAMNLLPATNYSQCTVLQLQLLNTRSAVAGAAGNNVFNCIATRILPTWTGSAWGTPAASTRWADALVCRMKAADGANKVDADIDIVGIYAIQTALNAIDSGDQGKISMTLDQMQDIDAELQSIATLVRCSVYRIGKKLYVTRDQGGKSAVALFTGRSKSPDGETLTYGLKSDAEADAVIVQWVDAGNAWKLREYQFPESITPINPLRLAPPLANWAQAWRRAQYEWNRIQLRRDSITFNGTDEARLIVLGDVVNVADDVSHLASTAGEIVSVAGLVLQIDSAIFTGAGYSILLRSFDGRATDTIAVTITDPTHVTLARAPVFPIQGRADGMGTAYAVYNNTTVVRPWLVTGLQPQAPYIQVAAVNYRSDMFGGDTATLPAAPPLGV